jgi:hypothetical protein
MIFSSSIQQSKSSRLHYSDAIVDYDTCRAVIVPLNKSSVSDQGVDIKPKSEASVEDNMYPWYPSPTGVVSVPVKFSPSATLATDEEDVDVTHLQEASPVTLILSIKEDLLSDYFKSGETNHDNLHEEIVTVYVQDDNGSVQCPTKLCTLRVRIRFHDSKDAPSNVSLPSNAHNIVSDNKRLLQFPLENVHAASQSLFCKLYMVNASYPMVSHEIFVTEHDNMDVLINHVEMVYVDILFQLTALSDYLLSTSTDAQFEQIGRRLLDLIFVVFSQLPLSGPNSFKSSDNSISFNSDVVVRVWQAIQHRCSYIHNALTKP